jgi:hypothetical protein
LRAKQSSAIDVLVGQTVFDMLIFQVMWDETQFRLVPTGDRNGRGTDVSCFASHGRLVWSSDTDPGAVLQEDVSLCPMVLCSTAAASMWAAFKKVLPPTLWDLVSGNTANIKASDL